MATHAVLQIALQRGTPQTFSVSLAGVQYNMRVYFADTAPSQVGGGWLLDIADANNTPILCGRPLLPGVDLLNQYKYLGFNGALFVQDSGDWTKPPTFDDLGGSGTSQLYFVTAS